MQKRIVVVDDSLYMRTVLKTILSNAGHQIVAEAANGADAVTAILSNDPDLVTLDIILPDATGLDVLKRVREDLPNLKVIMVSAVGQDVIMNDALANGALAYIVKPFEEAKVLEAVNRAFSNAESPGA